MNKVHLSLSLFPSVSLCLSLSASLSLSLALAFSLSHSLSRVLSRSLYACPLRDMRQHEWITRVAHRNESCRTDEWVMWHIWAITCVTWLHRHVSSHTSMHTRCMCYMPHSYVSPDPFTYADVYYTTHSWHKRLRHVAHEYVAAVNTLQHACMTLQHDCNTLQHDCNALQHDVWTWKRSRDVFLWQHHILQHDCNMTATHCNHTATWHIHVEVVQRCVGLYTKERHWYTNETYTYTLQAYLHDPRKRYGVATIGRLLKIIGLFCRM